MINNNIFGIAGLMLILDHDWWYHTVQSMLGGTTVLSSALKYGIVKLLPKHI